MTIPQAITVKLTAAFSRGDAQSAKIIQLEKGMAVPFFDLVWLGMGVDGHIASLFPNADPQPEGDAKIISVRPDPLPIDAPYDRLSLNLSALTRAKATMLLIQGMEKKKVLEAAIAGENDLPVARFIHSVSGPITIFWNRT